MKNKNLLITLLIGLALLISACSSVAAQTPVPDKDLRTITVSGFGKSTLSPDIAYISIGVQTENKDVAEAVEENTSRSQKVIDALEKMGIDPKDIQTSNFSIYQFYPPERYDSPRLEDRLFRVDNTVRVKIKDLGTLGEVLSESIKAGANSILNLVFDVEDRTPVNEEVKRSAVADAKNTADILADAAGVKAGKVQSITFYSGGYPDEDLSYVRMEMSGGGVPISPGELTITAQVQIVYQIED